MYEASANVTVGGADILTCGDCDWPCSTCDKNKTDCITCTEGYLLYDVEHSCYEVIYWYFPFLGAAVFFMMLSWVADCCDRATNILHSVLYFLSYLEVALMGLLGYYYAIGDVKGDRNLTMAAFASHILLNLLFVVVHLKSILDTSSAEYRQVLKDFRGTFWCCNGVAYLLNFKMALILVSQFWGRPRFGGTFNADSWQKFNIFSVLYIILVYLPFMGDFYLYFMEFGLRRLTSYIAAELVIIMTIIALILLLEILNQCNCAGMRSTDLGRRAGLYDSKKKGAKGKRKAARSGMGNEESEYGSEDSGYGSELAEVEVRRPKAAYVASSESEEESVEDSISELAGKKGGGGLARMAKDMKEERERLEAEAKRLLEEETRLLREKGSWKEETDAIKTTLEDLKKDRQSIVEGVGKTIDEKLGAMDGNPRKNPLG